MRSLMNRAVLTLVVLFVFSGWTDADFIAFTDFGDWQSAAGPFHTITFTEFPDGTVVTDQYLGLGIEFDSTPPPVIDGGSYLDGLGLESTGDIFLEFSVPQFEFGAHYPGALQIEVFSEGEQVFIDDFFVTGFGGIVSDQPFDAIRLSVFDGPPVFVDNIYFTVPAPGAFMLLGLGGLVAGTRKRSC